MLKLEPSILVNIMMVHEMQNATEFAVQLHNGKPWGWKEVKEDGVEGRKRDREQSKLQQYDTGT